MFWVSYESACLEIYHLPYIAVRKQKGVVWLTHSLVRAWIYFVPVYKVPENSPVSYKTTFEKKKNDAYVSHVNLKCQPTRQRKNFLNSKRNSFFTLKLEARKVLAFKLLMFTQCLFLTENQCLHF